jgi:hypothetical protein
VSDQTFRERLLERFKAAENGDKRSVFGAGAREALRLAADDCAADHIVSGSIGPLMDAGYNMACKRRADELRRLASELESPAGGEQEK